MFRKMILILGKLRSPKNLMASSIPPLVLINLSIGILSHSILNILLIRNKNYLKIVCVIILLIIWGSIRKRKLRIWRSKDKLILSRKIGKKYKILYCIRLTKGKCLQATCFIMKNLRKIRKVSFKPLFNLSIGVSLCTMTKIGIKRSTGILIFWLFSNIIH